MNKNLPVVIKNPDKQYIIGFDFATKYDYATIIAISRHKDGSIIVEHMKQMQVEKNDPDSKAEFDKALDEMKKYFNVPTYNEDGSGWSYPTSKEEYFDSITESRELAIIQSDQKLMLDAFDKLNKK